MFEVRKIIVVVVLHVLLLSSVAHASFDKAMAIYGEGRFEEAKVAFETLAAIGDRSSLFNLGVMYYRGEAVERDPVEAYVLMKIANDGFNEQSFTRLSNSVFSQFNADQKIEADRRFSELNPVYSISAIKANIFPKPLSDEDCPPDIQPIRKVAPRYPKSENRSGRMGLTHLEFTISPEGYPRDLAVTRSTNYTFTKTSVRAAKQFLYQPPIDQKPIYGHRTVFIYQLKNTELGTSKITRELSDLESAASDGDVIAQYRYASRLNTFRYFKSYLKKIDLQYKTANEWFTKSAENGLPHAQFEIGRNMLQGRGCEIDVVNGYKWINAAAIGGYSPAQKALAQSALSKSELSVDRSMAAMAWLKNAAQDEDYAARLLLAWELSTSNIKELRNGEEALRLLDNDPEDYFDEVRIMETQAAAYAEIGNYKKAVKLQKKAKKMAQKLDWDIPLISERLGLYQHNEVYRGSYY
ncbi:energy transducer TonB [Oceanicoccus sp. KOV_DT_Chl]|uniref:energy transducer TonB n=1 Tax=Oceanicoccus sp. KOV_DT_Chl TaxID=1904639 RepID=UPI000C7B741F|nr:energy transducer TonB [Oceanicoccus sp. KOV_DT_Chl]